MVFNSEQYSLGRVSDSEYHMRGLLVGFGVSNLVSHSLHEVLFYHCLAGAIILNTF